VAKQTKAELAKFRSDIKQLRAKGLVSSKVDLRKVKPTKHYRKVVRQNEDVLSGESVVVRIFKGLASLFNSETGTRQTRARMVAAEVRTAHETRKRKVRVHGNKVIVPREEGGTFTYNKKTQKITRQVRVGGRTKSLPTGRGDDDIQQYIEAGFTVKIWLGAQHSISFRDYRTYRDWIKDTYEQAGRLRPGQLVLIPPPAGRSVAEDDEDEE
jgi:hypothetical protein